MAVMKMQLAISGNAVLLLCCALAMGWLHAGATAQYTQVGLGIFFLNVGKIDLAGSACYLDYLLTVRQLNRTLPTFDTATMYGGLQRVCPSNSSAEEWLEWRGQASDISVPNLERAGTIKKVDDTDSVFRVQGAHYFQTNLEKYPFETQILEAFIEIRRQPHGDVSKVALCQLEDYDGLSSWVRFPGEAELALQVDHDVKEQCWPPFSAPHAICKSATGITSDCPCDPPPIVYHNESRHFSCRCQGGKKLSSRYTAMIYFDRPENTAFIRVLLPAVFILLVIIMTYLLPPKTADAKQTVVPALNASSVAATTTDPVFTEAPASLSSSASSSIELRRPAARLQSSASWQPTSTSGDSGVAMQPLRSQPARQTEVCIVCDDVDNAGDDSTHVTASATAVRFKMCAATLLSAIFYHVSLINQLPPTSIFTVADKLMINLYAMNIMSWVVTITFIMMEMGDRKSVPWSDIKKTYRFTRIVGPIFSLPPFFITFFTEEGREWVPPVVLLLAALLSALCYQIQEKVYGAMKSRRKEEKDGRTRVIKKNKNGQDDIDGEAAGDGGASVAHDDDDLKRGCCCNWSMWADYGQYQQGNEVIPRPAGKGVTPGPPQPTLTPPLESEF